MALRIDPRADLPAVGIHSLSYYSRPTSLLSQYDHRRSNNLGVSVGKHQKKPCYDWIFSSASNVHVAIDHAAFKNYVPFKSYVLAVADQRRVSVQGIGSVDLKLRRRPGSEETHTIRLENVLHIPDWLCNIFSDTFFRSNGNYEHTWSKFGLTIFQKERNKLRPWCFTENFFGLEKIVLTRKAHGRSPMVEDQDREVFSVNVIWPHSQREEWVAFLEIKARSADKTSKPKFHSERKSDNQASEIQSERDTTYRLHLKENSSPKKQNSKHSSRNVLARISSNISLQRKVSISKVNSFQDDGNIQSSFKEGL